MTLQNETRVVGRDQELRHLAGLCADAAGGVGRVGLISGAAGIGKSRVATEVMRRAGAAGFVVLHGAAHPLHTGLAYAPLVEAVGPYLRSQQHELPAGLNDLGRLFPDLRLPAPEPLGDPALEKTRLFEAVVRALAGIARRRPVLLFVDDLHWADPATLELVHYVARGLTEHRLLLLVTYRRGEVTTATPLGEFVHSMRRRSGAAEVSLGPLDGAAVTDLLLDLLGAEPPEPLAEAVIKRADGVPLFVTALVGQLVDSGGLRRTRAGWELAPGSLDLLPTIVRDVVLARLIRLGPAQRRLLELIGVAGESSTADLLEAVWHAGCGPFGEVLRELVEDGLVVEEEQGGTLRCRIAHPLYAEVAHAEMTELERRRTHAEVAAVLERLRPQDVVALAPHYRHAAELLDPVRTLDVLSCAGLRALELHADQEAVQYLGAALRKARDLGDRGPISQLCGALGQAHQRRGELDSAARAWQEGLHAAQEEGEQRSAGMLHHRLALLEWDRGNNALAMEHLTAGQGTDLASAHWEAEQLCIRTMLLARQWADTPQREASRQLAELAALVERHPRSVLARAALHLVRAYLALDADDPVGAKREAELLLPLAEETGNEMVVGTTWRMLAVCEATLGNLDAARDHAARLVDVTHRLGVPTLECSARATLAGIHYLTGDWDCAMSEAESAISLARRSGSARGLAGGLLTQVVLLARRGRLREARACFDAAEEAYGTGLSRDRNITTGRAVAAAAIACAAGDRADVLAVPHTLFVHNALPGAANLLVLADGLLAGRDCEAALGVARRLRSIASGTAPLPIAIADRIEGQVARLRGEPVPRLLASAEDRFVVLGMPVEAAVARLERAETMIDLEPAAAGEAAAQCLADFERVGARPLVDRTRLLLRRLGVRSTGRVTAGVLSDREREVAALVAEGLSNAEIAGRLFLSVRTVETHLHHIYARLGLESRVALAQWATQRT